MIEPVILKLTKEIIDSLSIEEIIYAEISLLGTWNKEGGIMLYILKDNNLICYKENINSNKNIYNDAVDILEKNSISSRKNNVKNENGIFKFYGGRKGNSGFINKDISLEVRDRNLPGGWFIYSKNNIKYGILSSAYDVYDRIEHSILLRMRREMGEKPRKLKDYLKG
jgi:hypothetical protein